MQRSSRDLQAVITEFPDLVSNGVIDLMTGSAPLHAAARGGSAEAVKAVLDAGADIEARDGNGWTALRVRRLFPDCTELIAGCSGSI
jgi:ankyrin repeat protein